MERHNSKLCFNGFSIGGALGGEKEETELRPSQLGEQGILASCSHFGEEEHEKVQTIADSEFSATVDDRESETDSSRKPTRKRSKRSRKPSWFPSNRTKKQRPSQLSESWTEPEPVSSVSDATTEEDLAFCLMMLSTEKRWNTKEREQYQNQKKQIRDDVESDKNETGGNYKCETCSRVFKSYQALGGHRASHKKRKSCGRKTEQENGWGDAEKKIHKCPVCFRVFSSGQALGGHKRSHGTLLTETDLSKNSRRERIIDLNLPAPIDHDGDEMISAASAARL